MNTSDKKLLKAVVKRVHPDLFNDLHTEREQNSTSLQALNSYLADITKQGSSKAVVLSFWAKDRSTGELVRLKAELPAWGSIGPLLYVFGLITEDELIEGKGSCSGKGARNVLSWLESSVAKAADAAEEHEALRAEIRTLKASLEQQFGLAAIKLGKEYSTSVREQKRNIEALQALRDCLTALSRDVAQRYEGLQIQLHHSSLPNDGFEGQQPSESQNYVGDEGTLHIVMDATTMLTTLSDMDLRQAQLLSQVAGFWQRRSKDMIRALKAILGIQKIWCDSANEHANQRFVEWAAKLLDKRSAPLAQETAHTHSFSLLLHTDENSPFIEFTPASAMLQVRCDTDPEELLAYLDTTARSEAVTAAEDKNKEEEQILEELKNRLGLKHAIRVCASTEQDNVVSAAKRLLEHQDYFKAAGIKLEGASLAFDNCYEVWESGFISIPHDFRLEDLKPKLQALLTASSSILHHSGEQQMHESHSSESSTVEVEQHADIPMYTASNNGNGANPGNNGNGASPGDFVMQPAIEHEIRIESRSGQASQDHSSNGLHGEAALDISKEDSRESGANGAVPEPEESNEDLRELQASVARAKARLHKVQTHYVRRRPLLVPPNFEIANSSWKQKISGVQVRSVAHLHHSRSYVHSSLSSRPLDRCRHFPHLKYRAVTSPFGAYSFS